jgi:CBS domain-containing protein
LTQVNTALPGPRKLALMKAQDVMTTWVASIGAGATVQEAARLMAERRISALPVVDGKDRLVGIVSEGDLVRRAELGTQEEGSWWLKALAENTARDYVKSHAKAVQDVMTTPVLTVRPGTPLAEVASLMLERGVKRLPVLEAGRLVGVVSRADLVRALAAQAARP